MQEMGIPVVFDATHSVQLPGGAGESSSGERKYVCTLAKVPFIIIRTISDVLDFEGTKRDFSELALESCKILAHFIKV